jgi:hypothetical protein
MLKEALDKTRFSVIRILKNSGRKETEVEEGWYSEMLS